MPGIDLAKLKDLCRKHGVSTTGNKAVLVATLNKELRKQGLEPLPRGSENRSGGPGGNSEHLRAGRRSAALKEIAPELFASLPKESAARRARVDELLAEAGEHISSRVPDKKKRSRK